METRLNAIVVSNALNQTKLNLGKTTLISIHLSFRTEAFKIFGVRGLNTANSANVWGLIFNSTE